MGSVVCLLERTENFYSKMYEFIRQSKSKYGIQQKTRYDVILALKCMQVEFSNGRVIL